MSRASDASTHVHLGVDLSETRGKGGEAAKAVSSQIASSMITAITAPHAGGAVIRFHQSSTRFGTTTILTGSILILGTVIFIGAIFTAGTTIGSILMTGAATTIGLIAILGI